MHATNFLRIHDYKLVGVLGGRVMSKHEKNVFTTCMDDHSTQEDSFTSEEKQHDINTYAEYIHYSERYKGTMKVV
jgi:hypothetical protein